MRIKRLEIVGFKSFCDRTVLHFNDPITGVVGPNGCGKSNVVDAIRWCMGEQSAKYLRGKSMDDVIFSGSDARGPAGMCEVSITFENDGRVPVEYMAYSELTVTRKLYRDGTSEYLLNNTPCRLRDVTDFFLGTGIGAKAYSIIEQGRVGMVVTSKPEDRRFLIEEAAGITKYKLKKKAAEKKMESTRQNLQRVSDVVLEIEKQLGSLRRQAQKAERYKQYKAEVRDIELWSASQRWLGIHAEARVGAARLTELQEARGAALTAVATREAGIAAARLAAAEEERRISGMQERLYELESRIKLGEAEVEHQGREADDLDERGHAEAAEIEHIGRLLEEGRVERARLAAELAGVEEARAVEVEALAEREAQHRAAKEALATVERALDAAKGDIARAQTDIARADQAERSLARRAEDLDVRLGRVSEEGTRLGSREGELREGVAALDEKLAGLRRDQARLGEQRETHEERLAELKELLARDEKELERLRGELHKQRARHHSLEQIAAKYEGVSRGTRAVMQRRPPVEGAAGWGVRGLVADVLRAPAEYEVAVEAALGDRLGSVVVDSPEVGIDGVEYLKERREGRASFVPLRARPPATAAGAREPGDDDGVRGALVDLVECDEEYRAVVASLLGDVLVVDDLLRAVDLWKAGERRRLVTMDGEVVDATGLVTGGSREAQGAGVLQQKRELRELEVTLGKLERDHATLGERVAAMRDEKQEVEQALESLRRARHQGEMAVLAHEKDVVRLRDELERLSTRAGALGREREELAAQRAEVSREAEELRLEGRAARERLAGAEELRVSRGHETVGLMERLEEAAAALTEFKVRAGQAQERRASLAQALSRTEGLLREQEGRRGRLERSITDGAERAARLRERIAARRVELVDEVARSRAAAEELRAARTAYDATRGTLLEAEAAIKGLRGDLDAVTAAVSELELKLRSLDLGRVHLEEQVAERWRVRVVDELIDYHLRPPVGPDEEARLGELRDLIDRMGEINLTAIEEYNALEGRYTFLSSQKSDLEAALAQLEEAIAQINRTSRKRFQEVFDLINTKFQELFPRLFRGGHAHLALTSPDDVLESGIEIVAQPPGKKNATIELLSGGEKALTAVSLIFAIFLVKPSPFCLLDEVDAPLDEANVGRFNDMVRAMTDRSQFIIITHNKRTMEIADTLYGVTMEQPGVSKLVSVNLSTVGKKAAA